ncbi:MAG: cytochrome c-type biosis protein CcmF [Pseudomonadota bacterium]|jgi:cytochrome c-type biogenesis protein CcmF
MAQFGHFALCVAWLTALFGVFAGLYGGRSGKRGWCGAVVNATVLVGVCAGLATAVLCYGFYVSDFSNQYIWEHSNRDMPGVYKISALWGGMDGSMLLWAFFLTLCGAIVAIRSHTYPRTLMPWVLAVVNSSSLFFLTVVVFFTNPFRYIKAPFIPPDGNGLNPLLQNPFMAIHPPTLYAGFTTFSIPFAFCIGALLAGHLSNEWIRLTRRWTLVSWGFLTAGIVLGGYWAYIELGWGGFWAWDPVENASFLPWLTGTAFLHSVMVQERKNMLKFWNIWLIVLTYGLTVFGTFLTRSGVVQSVHAFASTDIGWIFLVYIGIVAVAAAILSFVRRGELASERKIESLFSREAAFLLNNLIFLSICFATLWGVMFPVLSEAVTGKKQAVGIPFFNAVNVPLFMGLIFLMGVGPLIAWRRASLGSLKKTFLAPFLSAFFLGVLMLWAGVFEFWPTLAYSLSFFVVLTIMGEIHRGLKAQRVGRDESSVVSGVQTLVRRHRVRYGGHLVHFGVVIVTIAITASMAHKVEKEFSLAQGESYKIGRFELTLDGLKDIPQRNYQALTARVSARTVADNSVVKVLEPEMRFYPRNKENTTEVALYHSVREDLYLVLAGLDDSGKRAAFKVFINPLQIWLWVGAIIMIIGTVIVALPQSREVPVVDTVRGGAQGVVS